MGHTALAHTKHTLNHTDSTIAHQTHTMREIRTHTRDPRKQYLHSADRADVPQTYTKGDSAKEEGHGAAHRKPTANTTVREEKEEASAAHTAQAEICLSMPQPHTRVTPSKSETNTTYNAHNRLKHAISRNSTGRITCSTGAT